MIEVIGICDRCKRPITEDEDYIEVGVDYVLFDDGEGGTDEYKIREGVEHIECPKKLGEILDGN